MSNRVESKENEINHLGQIIGFKVDGWQAALIPEAKTLFGSYCDLVPLEPSLHQDQLFEAFSDDSEGYNWTYLPYGPFNSKAEFCQWLESISHRTDPIFYTVMQRLEDGELHANGLVSFLRVTPEQGVIEVGHIHYSNRLQKTPAATEAMYLMMNYAFEELGYRRYEWKCNALNSPSMRAAERLGFIYEGTFRQAVVTKGRNRDSAWFSILDSEWAKQKNAFENWLQHRNFSEDGLQIQTLESFK